MNSRKLNIRGLNYHIQEWGDSSKPLLILLHGWMDCGATYKFVSEYLISDYFLVAPDWRGFGQTDHAPGYWFPDYFADLEKILDHYTPDTATNLIGHSMGGNIAPRRRKNIAVGCAKLPAKRRVRFTPISTLYVLQFTRVTLPWHLKLLSN